MKYIMLVIAFFTFIASDSIAFSDDDLSAYLNSNLICLKSNAGESDLYLNYGIDGVPTTVFISPGGEEINRMVGYRPPDDFYQDMQVILSQWEH